MPSAPNPAPAPCCGKTDEPTKQARPHTRIRTASPPKEFPSGPCTKEWQDGAWMTVPTPPTGYYYPDINPPGNPYPNSIKNG